jgi:hypothetical protein
MGQTMQVTMMEILGSDGAGRPILSLERATRDALAKYTALRWPVGRRKAVEREWTLTVDEARAVCEGTAGTATIDKIWKHKNGGWIVAFPVLGAVIGQDADDFLLAMRRKHVELARRSGAVVRDLRALPDLRGDGASQLAPDVGRERRTYRG